MKTPLIEPMVTEFTVSLLPEGHQAWFSLALRIRWRGNDRWSVHNTAYVLSKSGDRDVEVRDDRDDEEWMNQHRFTRDEAIAFAVRMAPHMSVAGKTAAEWAAES